MSLLFHIMSLIDTDGPVGLVALIDKQLSGLILEGRRRQQPRWLQAGGIWGGRSRNWSQISPNLCPRVHYSSAADISSKCQCIALNDKRGLKAATAGGSTF